LLLDAGNVFSNYNVNKGPQYDFIEGVYLIGGETLENKIFKIMLMNNNQFFTKDSGAEFRAQETLVGAEKFKFIAAKEEDTYYL